MGERTQVLAVIAHGHREQAAPQTFRVGINDRVVTALRSAGAAEISIANINHFDVAPVREFGRLTLASS
jgi:hypothetical protein